MDRVNYWMNPNFEFLPSTGCMRTGEVVTFHQMPRSAWSCPDEYPSLPKHPRFNNYMWWTRPGLADMGRVGGSLLVGGLVVGVALLAWHMVGDE